MKYIFLDVDGVLNNENTKESNPSGYVGVSMKLVRNLAKIVKATDAKIILTSDWKHGWSEIRFCCDEDVIYLLDKLKKCGLMIHDRTYDEKIEDNFFTDRGAGIRHFLESCNDGEGYVIIDDHVFADFDEEQKTHFVHTDSKNGLTEDDVNKAIEILSDQERKMM